MDQIQIHIVWTVVVFITFIGIVLWAYSGYKKKDFDDAAHLILEDDLPVKNNNQGQL